MRSGIRTPHTGWNGPIGKTRSVWVIYCGFRTGDPWWTQRCCGPEDILSETHTHTRAPEERAPYTCILAVSLIPVSDKATSSIWYVCKNKSSSESLYSPPITSLGRLLRDKKDRSRCSIDLYRDASCRPRAWKICKYTRTHWTSLSVSERKHAGDDRTTT